MPDCATGLKTHNFHFYAIVHIRAEGLLTKRIYFLPHISKIRNPQTYSFKSIQLFWNITRVSEAVNSKEW